MTFQIPGMAPTTPSSVPCFSSESKASHPFFLWGWVEAPGGGTEVELTRRGGRNHRRIAYHFPTWQVMKSKNVTTKRSLGDRMAQHPSFPRSCCPRISHPSPEAGEEIQAHRGVWFATASGWLRREKKPRLLQLPTAVSARVGEAAKETLQMHLSRGIIWGIPRWSSG